MVVYAAIAQRSGGSRHACIGKGSGGGPTEAAGDVDIVAEFTDTVDGHPIVGVETYGPGPTEIGVAQSDEGIVTRVIIVAGEGYGTENGVRVKIADENIAVVTQPFHFRERDIFR